MVLGVAEFDTAVETSEREDDLVQIRELAVRNCETVSNRCGTELLPLVECVSDQAAVEFGREGHFLSDNGDGVLGVLRMESQEDEFRPYSVADLHQSSGVINPRWLSLRR